MFTTKFALFGLVLSLIRASSEWQLMKCCPPGEIFLFNEFTCLPVPLIFSIEVYSHYWNIEFQGSFQCNESEDLMTSTLDDFDSNTILQVPACLELFYKIGENKHIIIIHYCRPNKDQQVKTINASFEQFLHIRRCCFGDTIFDSSTKACVTQINETQSLGAVLINRSTAESAVILSFSPLICKGPIVNYEIKENDIFLRSNTYSVMVPELNNIVKEEPVIGDNICIEMMSEFAVKRSLAVRICRKPEFCDKNACIRKCCSEDGHFYFDERQGYGCNTPPVPNNPGKFYNALANAVNQSKSFTFDTTKVHGIWSDVINPFIYTPCIEIHRFWDPDEWEERMSSKSNGHTNDRHCFDVVEDKVNNSYRFELLYCDEYTVKQNYSYNNTINDVVQRPPSYSRLIVIKGVFLLMTLLVYALLPNLQNIHGKMVICYVSNVLLSNIHTFIAISFNEVLLEQQRGIECKFLYYIGFFSGHATVFWLNVMCFDMWRTITTFKNRKNYNNRKRFLLYCLYGWGIPLLLSILIIVADNTYFLPEYLIPDIGNISCGIIVKNSWDNYGDLIFKFGPETILLISNVVFFILTTKYYSNVKVNIKSRTDPRSKQLHSNRKRFIMIFKLFIVMGMRLIIDTVQYYLFKSSNSYPNWNVFFITLSIFDGILIFIILVLKKSVYQAIRKRLQDIRKNQPAT